MTIASTEELKDAVEQFSSQDNPVLRITTDVKRIRESSRETTNPTSTPETAAPTGTADRSASAGRTANLQQLVESLVSIMAAAIVAIQQKMHFSSGSTVTPSPKEVAAVALASMEADQARELDETAEKLVRQVIGSIAMGDAPAEAPTPPAPASKPFIHGRHTCDGCLCTPIVGVRYHAKNIPDYDLCAKCRDNYKGNEIQFEPQELGKCQMEDWVIPIATSH